MMQATNGNFYRSSDVDGTSSRSTGSRKRKQTQPAKYNKFDDMRLTTQQKKQVKYMAKRLVKSPSELKYVENSFVANASSNVWQIFPISQPSIGSGDSNRVGDQISLVNMELRWRTGLPSAFTVSNGNQVIRMVMFQYYLDTSVGGLPLASTIFQTTGSAGAYLTPYNHDQRADFKILYDETVTLSTNGPDVQVRTVKCYPGRKKVNFVGATTQAQNLVFIAYIADATVTGQALVDYYTRTNFYDN